MEQKMRILLLILSLFATLPSPAIAQVEEYPGRAVYPMVKVYNTGQLDQSFAEVNIVDVRSSYEYDTLHINNAINIPLGSKDFSEQISKLAGNNKPIVFYCNGHTCYKSYKGVLKARKAGIGNVFSYDSGIFDWAKAHPKKSTMLGRSPIDPDRLISKSKLEKHLLQPKQFSQKINNNTVILDIREPHQRKLMDLYPYRQENIALNQKDKLVKLLSGIQTSGKTLLVYDEAGKQVRWLQYYLEAKGIKNYYFMAGGVKQFFKDI
jgi:rhodanese-related sulfurtransferase